MKTAPLHIPTIDTEFMRDRTYWPILCLVQIAGPDEAAAIDPLADGIDLAPLLAMMQHRGVLKVFHAARQDIEIFAFHMTGAVPAPVFDTQVAAMVCGFGDSVSYETLASRLAGAQIDKIVALHRLGAPAADRSPAQIRARRRDPAAPGL